MSRSIHVFFFQVVRLAFGVTSLSFVGCHLCAHEGQQHYNARNSSCAEILEGARLGNRMTDVSLNGHHCFFMGDLNYRVDFGVLDLGLLLTFFMPSLLRRPHDICRDYI